MSAVGVYPLACPECGGELEGLEFDVLFACRTCAVAVDPVRRERLAWEELLVDAELRRRSLLLPFWRFAVGLTVSGGDGAARRAAERVAQRTPLAWVAAFAVTREEVFGELGLIWTRRQEPVAVRPRLAGEPRLLVGIRRGEEVAARHTRPYLLQLVDEQHDLTGLEVETEVRGRGALFGVPFRDDATHLVDPVSGLRYPAAAIEDLAALREIAALSE